MKPQPYTVLKGKHEGETAFICGAGTSFNDIINHARWNEVHNHVVVSVNSSFIVMPWGEGSTQKRYWISNDVVALLWSYWSDLKKAAATRVVRDSWERWYPVLPECLYFWRRPTPEHIVNPDDEGLAYCSSVPSALDLCIQMGCKQIFLLGIDQYMSDGKSHFWEFWEKSRQPKRRDGRLATVAEQVNAFNYNDLAYPALKTFADIKGVKVYNCNLKSNVTAFEKISFDEALLRVGEQNGS